jgi:hypothetical protein
VQIEEEVISMHGMNIKIKYINLGNVNFVGLYRIIVVRCMVKENIKILPVFYQLLP